MKLITLILLLFAGIPSAWADDGNGAFLLTKSDYLYETLMPNGTKYFTKRRSAFSVLDVVEKKDNTVFYQILFPFLKEKITGSGFILENDEELQQLGEGPIKVYPVVPTEQNKFPGFVPVLTKQLSFTGKSEKSPLFPGIIWRVVDYKTSVPKKMWVSSEAGIFRLDKDAAWFNRVWKEIRSKKYNFKIRKLLLMGLVENGFTKEQVLLALGEPTKKVVKEAEDGAEWIYPDKKIIFKANIVQQVL